ncbi:hypothetical protein [Candidatus Electronema sp. JC]|uniref:hypothetical protein n=1 Tax=Candidatus Electronema sp. JC TaxID=3401570 RepID=UPI003B437F1B
MLTNSIPKLLQEANEVKQALAAIGAGLPPEISAAGMEARIAELEAVISELDAVNADRTRLVNLKRDKAEAASDYIVQSRAVVKGIFGADSSEYNMVGGTRVSERSRPKAKDDGTE